MLKKTTAHLGQFWTFPAGKKFYIGYTGDASACQRHPLALQTANNSFPTRCACVRVCAHAYVCAVGWEDCLKATLSLQAASVPKSAAGAVTEISVWHFTTRKGENPPALSPCCSPLGTHSQAGLPAREDRILLFFLRTVWRFWLLTAPNSHSEHLRLCANVPPSMTTLKTSSKHSRKLHF